MTEKWITVQIWRRKRKGGVTYALRWGARQRPFTEGIGACTEEYAEARRREKELEINGMRKILRDDELKPKKLEWLRDRLEIEGFTEKQIEAVLEIVAKLL